MATATIKIEAGRITRYSDRYFVSLSEDGLRYEGNGWTVEIRGGAIVAHAERVYSDGPAVCHREFRLEDGTLGLAGGNIRSRYAYFRPAAFQAFLDKFGLTAVKREDPNRQVEFPHWTEGDIWSDGQIETSYREECGHTTVVKTVSGATWTIVETRVNYRDRHSYAKILYTEVKGDVKRLGEDPFFGRKDYEVRTAKELELVDGINALRGFDTQAEMLEAISAVLGREMPEDQDTALIRTFTRRTDGHRYAEVDIVGYSGTFELALTPRLEAVIAEIPWGTHKTPYGDLERADYRRLEGNLDAICARLGINTEGAFRVRTEKSNGLQRLVVSLYDRVCSYKPELQDLVQF